MKQRKIFIGFILWFFLAACNHGNQQMYEGQSLEEDNIIPQKENNGAEIEEIGVEEVHPPGFGVPQIEPSKQAEYEQQSGPKIQQKGETPKFSFDSFKELWNVISNESGLTATSFEKVESEEEDFYRSSITDHLELRVVVTKDNLVQKVQLLNTGQTSSELLSMLDGWSQMVHILNPEIEPHHIDTLYHELGVGPNLDFSQVVGKTVEMGGVLFTIQPLERGYLFEASYPETSFQ